MNSVKCLDCDKILVSKSRHDFQQCGCSNETFIDGGEEYQRYGGKDMSLVKVLGDWEK